MDIEHAFERRKRFLERIERIMRWGIPLPEEHHRRDRFFCPNAAFGFHSEPNWRGRCAYCDRQLTKIQRPNTGEYYNVLDSRLSKSSREMLERYRLNIDPNEDDYYD